MAAIAMAVVACSSSDAHVGCSPSLTCSLHDARFKPAPKLDAGPPACDQQRRRCAATKIATGASHSCAIAAAGELFCWGSDAQSQRGEGVAATDLDAASAEATTTAGRGAASSAAQFTRLRDKAAQVSAGGAHTCAIGVDGLVRCWGRDSEGQVDGMARPVAVRNPVVLDVAGATGIDAGDAHTCAIVSEGVVCWGSARFGQVGREVSDTALSPGIVPGTADAIEVAAGVRHTCARLRSGRVLCWGELIDETSGEALPTADAVEIKGLDDATVISAGAGHSCAVRASGGLVCWGANQSGQLGNGTTDSSATPVSVSGLGPVLRVAAGGAERDGQLVGHSCAVDSGFFVHCWGRNVEGQLGIGMTDDNPRPSIVLGLEGEADEPYVRNVTAIDTGAFHTCVIDHDGPALCWGADSDGQLGGDPHDSPSFGRATRVSRFDG